MSRELKKYLILGGISLLMGCTKPEEAEREKIRQMNRHAEYIYRSSEERLFELSPPKHCPREKYPWEEKK